MATSMRSSLKMINALRAVKVCKLDSRERAKASLAIELAASSHRWERIIPTGHNELNNTMHPKKLRLGNKNGWHPYPPSIIAKVADRRRR